MKVFCFIICYHASITTSFTLLPSFSFQLPKSRLEAESGPPKYDKIDGIVRSSEELAPGSVMLHIEAVDNEDKSVSLDYKPGHVIALEIQDDNSDEDDKWMIGPYTISRSTEKNMDVLLRVVGKKSEAFANCDKDTPIRFGGKFKVPILEGISKETTKKITFISTGVGVGPMVGAIESAIADGTYPPIELFALYRTKADIVYKEHLDELSRSNPSLFKWNAIISSDDTGRLSSEKNIGRVFDNSLGIEDTHYHLIGNALMVKEWQAGLVKGNVPEEKVTIEQYFNHKAQADYEVVETIAKAVAKNTAVTL